jgi:hypothetical protein
VVGPRYSNHHTDTPFSSSTPDIYLSVDSTDSKICVRVRYGLQLPPSLHQPLQMPSSELLLPLPNPVILIFFILPKKNLPFGLKYLPNRNRRSPRFGLLTKTESRSPYRVSDLTFLLVKRANNAQRKLLLHGTLKDWTKFTIQKNERKKRKSIFFSPQFSLSRRSLQTP